METIYNKALKIGKKRTANLCSANCDLEKIIIQNKFFDYKNGLYNYP